MKHTEQEPEQDQELTQEEREDRLDSNMGMQERGTPYSMLEAESAFERTSLVDDYYKQLAQFLIARVKRLEKERDAMKNKRLI